MVTKNTARRDFDKDDAPYTSGVYRLITVAFFLYLMYYYIR